MVILNEIESSSSDEEKENEEMEMEEAEITNEENEGVEDESGENTMSRVYLPSRENNTNVTLECDESAYVCYHALRTGNPCLSFDVIPDNLGENRQDQYPLTMSLIGGTQNERAHSNILLVMKLSNMHQTNSSREDEEDESDSESEEDEEDKKPVYEFAPVRHPGSVNRVKITKYNENIIASSWSELGKVFIWDLTSPIKAINDHRAMTQYIQNDESPSPVFTFSGHLTEGYAMEWSPLIPGMLVTGDCRKNIHLWKPLEGSSWHVDQRPFVGHTDSVEDIQWSPNESNVMASCSVDKSIRIWDVRVASHKACMLTCENAHDSDVNVISWNKQDPFILSGGDDGKLRIWDLRKFPTGSPICTFKHHISPITSVEWHPTDHSVFAASGADDQVTQWDLATERDDAQEEESLSLELQALPPQLLFIHQGQQEIKELHWHRQMPGVLITTALSGFNVFRTLSV